MIAIVHPRNIDSSSLMNLSLYGAIQTFDTLGLPYILIRDDELSLENLSRAQIALVLGPDGYSPGNNLVFRMFLDKGKVLIKSDFFMSGGFIRNQKLVFENNEPKYISLERWITHKGNHQIFENIPDAMPFFFIENKCISEEIKPVINNFDIINAAYEKIINAADFIPAAKGYITRLNFPLFANIGFILAGTDDTILSRGIKKDAYGRTIGKSALLYKHNLINQPVVHNFQKLFFNILIWLALDNNIPLITKSFWPGKYRMSVCLTHDVDDVVGYAHIGKRLLEVLLSKDISFSRKVTVLKIMGVYYYSRFLLKKAPSLSKISNILNNPMDVYEGYFKEWVELEKKYGFSATYFLLSRYDFDFNDAQIKKVVGVLKSLNFDIQVHGSIEASTDKVKMLKEKERFENIIGNKAYGMRQHGLVFELPQTWQMQYEAGYLFDSSVYYNDLFGFRMGTSLPFKPYYCLESGDKNFIELPLVVMEETVFAKEYSGLSEEEGLRVFREIFNEVRKNNGCLTVLWHPVTILEKELTLNRWKHNLRLKTLDLYNKLLEKISQYKDIWFANASEIINWWSERNRVNIRRIEFTKENIRLELLNRGVLPRMNYKLFTGRNVKNITVKTESSDGINNVSAENCSCYKVFTIELDMSRPQFQIDINITY